MVKKRKLGYAFLDEVSKITNPFSKLGKNYPKEKDLRIDDFIFERFDNQDLITETSIWVKAIFLILMCVTTLSLLARLFHLQIIQGAKFRDLADSNRIKIKIIHAPRGVIYDRSGKILAQNEPGFRLAPTRLQSARYIDRDTALKMEVQNNPQAKDLEIDSLRSYPLGEKAAHLVGFVGEITKEELETPEYSGYDYKFNPSGYQPGDQIGKTGVEKTYEKVLKGIDGEEIIEVDSLGKKIQTLRKTDPIPGQNLYLSIDASLQQKVYDSLLDGVKKALSCCGAAIVSDPKTGQILALASLPSFDPKNLESFLTAPNLPFLNRAISGEYPPGSTFKIATALAGLSSGKIKPETEILDTGVIYLGTFKFANWYFSDYGKVEGLVNLQKAIKRSNDIYFYHVGEVVGEDFLSSTAKKLGLGKTLGIDLPVEAAGLIPDDSWKRKNIGEAWFPGDTLHMAIGQGFVLVTPLQILNLISSVAADGKQYPPHLALKITTPDGFPVKTFKFDSVSVPFKETDVRLVRNGLEEVPKVGGTAWPFFSFKIPTAGKTGTAEYGDPKGRTHAWYTSYAPSFDPKIAVAVLVEGGGEGSNVAAPIVKDIYRWYFSKDKNHLESFDVYPVASESTKILGE